MALIKQDLIEALRLAPRFWYRRFRQAQDPREAYAAWHMHLTAVDLRHRLWKREDWPPRALAESARYEAAFRSEVEHACRKRAQELARTRFGVDR